MLKSIYHATASFWFTQEKSSIVLYGFATTGELLINLIPVTVYSCVSLAWYCPAMRILKARLSTRAQSSSL